MTRGASVVGSCARRGTPFELQASRSIERLCVALIVNGDDRVPLCTATFVHNIRFDTRERTQLIIKVDALTLRVDSDPIRDLRLR